MYLSDLTQTLKVSYINRRLTSISQAHEAASLETPLHSPLVKTTMKGIRRTLGSAPSQKTAAVVDNVQRMISTLPDTLIGTRDKALLLLGFAGALRRSELVALDVEDVTFEGRGMIITLRHSKTDQEGQGIKKGILYGHNPKTCPVTALKEWLEAAAIVHGPLFRYVDKGSHVYDEGLSAQTVALVVKRAAKTAGLDPKNYSGHSLRAGLATSAASAGVDERTIMKQTGHKSVTMVRKYIREGELFCTNAAGAIL